jgi:hypothetical protein
MINRLEKAEKIALEKILPVNNFRTVASDFRDTPCGISEIPVTIEFNKNFDPPYKDLVYGGCFVHGYIRMNEMLAKLNGGNPRKGDGSDLVRQIYLTDWDGAFLLSIALNQGGEVSYAVSNADVDNLLKNSMHPVNEMDTK